MEFGEKIRKARKDKKMTQREFAELIGAKHNSISNWENNQNKPDPDTIEKICGVLEISPSYLFAQEPQITFSEKEKVLLANYNKLNDIGKKKLIEYSEDLTGNKNYSIATAIQNNQIPLFDNTVEEEKDYLQPIAAHNDNITDEELELINQDLADMDNW